MFVDIIINAFRKIKSNYVRFILATIGITISSFVILIIFSFYHASKEVLIEYICNKFAGIDVITVKVEGLRCRNFYKAYSSIDVITVKVEDEDYCMDISELLELEEYNNINQVFFRLPMQFRGKFKKMMYSYSEHTTHHFQ